MVACPKCGLPNAQSRSYCTQCGTYLPESSLTVTLRPADLPGAAPDAFRRRDPEPRSGEAVLLLECADGRRLALPRVPTVNLGREDASRAGITAIDLRPFGADDCGVSRLHARIHRLSTGYFVEDCDSTNGTFLNGNRIIAYVPQGLSGGDELQLGQLQFTVRFDLPT